MRHIGLAGSLFAFWLVLSGHYTPMLVDDRSGVSAVLCVLAMIRVRVADAEGQPPRVVVGRCHLFSVVDAQDAKSASAITKIILHPSLPISPTMTVVRASQKTTDRCGILCELDHAHAWNDHRRQSTVTNSSFHPLTWLRALSISKAAGWTAASANSRVPRGSLLPPSPFSSRLRSQSRAPSQGPTVFDRVLAGNSVGNLCNRTARRGWLPDRASGVPRHRADVRAA